jgi:hypothetical protein
MVISRCISSGFHLLVILVYSPLWSEVFAEGLVDLEIISVHSSWRTLVGCCLCPMDSVIISISNTVRRCQCPLWTKCRQVGGNEQQPSVLQWKWEPSCSCCEVRGKIACLICSQINHLTPELNPSAQRCSTRFLLGIFLLEPCISLIYAWITNKCYNYSFY